VTSTVLLYVGGEEIDDKKIGTTSEERMNPL
jgi:hypothetical protein